MSGSLCPSASSGVDPSVQLQDIRLLETNIRKSVSSLQQLRRRYMLVVGLLACSSSYWTWQLRCKLAETAESEDDFASLRLWLAWALLGVTPLALFFAVGMYRSTIVEPSQFVHRLNDSLARFHLAYSTDRGQLLRVDPTSEFSLRKPLRLRSRR